MARRIIALYTQDMRYMKAFSDYCKRYESERLVVNIVPKQDDIIRYMEGSFVDLIVTDNPDSARKVRDYGKMAVILSEEKYVEAENNEYIYRFQKMDDIVRQIYGILAAEPGRKEVKCSAEKKVDITGIFSPCYEAEREQFARTLAKVYSEQCKVLYVNLASFSEYDDGDSDGISELIYFFNEDVQSTSYRLLNMLKESEGYYSVPGVRHYRDLYDISSGDTDRLFSCIRAMDDFDSIIIDIGFLSNAAYSVLGECNKVYMPVMDADSKRVRHLWHDLGADGHSELSDNIKAVELPDWWNIRKDMRYKWVGHGNY